MIHTLAANPEASPFELAAGTATGSMFGAIFPPGAFGSLGVGAVGAGSAYLAGGNVGTAYQVGSLTGAIVGGNLALAAMKGGTRAAMISSARRGTVELLGAAGGYGAADYFGANHNQALMAANFSAMGTGIIAGRFKFFQCFVAGTPVLVPVSELPVFDPAGTTTMAITVPPVRTEINSGNRAMGTALVALGVIGISTSGAVLIGQGRKDEETELDETKSFKKFRPQKYLNVEPELMPTQ